MIYSKYIQFFVVLCVAVGCSSSYSTEKKSFITLFSQNVMTIDYHIQIGQTLSDFQRKTVEEIISSTFSEADKVYNKWNPRSELSRLNQMPAQQKASVTPILKRLLSITDHVVKITEGRFDPTIDPLYQLWKVKLEDHEVPTSTEVAAIAPAIGWHNIHLVDDLFWKDHDLTSLDLGGIAKGFCVDLLVERLQQAGFNSIYVEWGGEIRTSGDHPDKRPWRIYISQLGDVNPDNAVAIIDLEDKAIATSGDYNQYWTVMKKSYFHILDPRTLTPLQIYPNSIASASVLAKNCAIADGLATAAMMFPSIEEAQKWVKEIQIHEPDTKFWLITR